MTHEDIQKRAKQQRLKNMKLQQEGKPQKVYNLLDEHEDANGEKYTECETCGKVFEQILREGIDTYTNFTNCPKCRGAVRKKPVQPKKIEEAVRVSTLKYEPYPWQKQFHEDCKKYKKLVLCCGARAGKNRACNMQIIMDWRDLLNENRHLTQPDLVPSILGWIVAPNEKMADQNWRELKAFFPKSWVVGISESTKTIQTIGGGIIEVRSAYNPEDLVAVGLDLVSVTEAARVKYLEEVSSNLEDRLQSPGRGIGGKGGRFMLDSSPLGKNFFYKMWCWGQENHPSHADAPDWKSYQIPTTGNPKMAARYAEEYKLKDGTIITYGESLRRRKGRRFDQDNMAMFLDRGGVVFPEFRAKCVIDIYAESKGKLTKEEIKEKRKEWRMPLPQSMYRVGYDPAKGSSGDTPAIVVRDMLTNNIVWVEDLYGKIDDAQLDAVAFCAKKYNNAEICLLTAGDLLAAGQLRKRGCVVTELGEQGQNKRLFVQGLQYVISNEDVHILDDGDATTETLIFEIEDYTEDPVTGKFGNQTLPNDDFVSALYACFYDYHSIPDVKTQYSSKMKGVRGNVPRMQALRRGRR